MRTLILLTSSPAAGKNYFLEQNNLIQYSLCADDIRLMFQGPVTNIDGTSGISQTNDRDVWQLLFDLLEKRMQRGELCIVNACHSKESDFAKYKKLASDYRYRIYAVSLRDVSIETCKKQNKMRPQYKWVPEDVIDKIYSRFSNQSIPKYVIVIKPNEIDEILKYKPLNFEQYKSINIFGDLHGCFDPIKEYFNNHPFSESEYYIFVGDLFDRGIQNGEVARWFYNIHDKQNVCLLASNHGNWVGLWGNNKDAEIKNKDFIFKTLPELEKTGFTREMARAISRKEAQMSYFSYHGKEFFVNHGGIPTLPEKLALIPSIELIKGVGKYEDMGTVAKTWLESTKENQYTVFGHRNIERLPVQVNERVYNLEGNIEGGGHLRIVRIKKEGVSTIEIKNNTFSAEKTIIIEDLSEEQLVKNLKTDRSILEKVQNKYPHISSFSFKRSVFNKGNWNDTNELARGLFINNQNNKIVIRSWPKFFNINENQENEPNRLMRTLKFPVQVYEKYNGFLGLVGYDEQTDGLVITSKTSSDSDFSKILEDIIDAKGISREVLKKTVKDLNCSIALEVISKLDPHIIEYTDDMVIILDCFIRSAKYNKFKYPFNEVEDLRRYMAVKEHFITLNNPDEFKQFTDRWCSQNINDNWYGEPIEGFVLEDTEGYCVKIKTAYYRFWKFMRSIKEKMSRGRPINLGGLDTPTANDFYGFLKTKGREYLESNSIIQLRNEFNENNKAI